MSHEQPAYLSVKGYYNYYGIPVKIESGVQGSLGSGYRSYFYDPENGEFYPQGPIWRILLDGIRISEEEFQELIAVTESRRSLSFDVLRERTGTITYDLPARYAYLLIGKIINIRNEWKRFFS